MIVDDTPDLRKLLTMTLQASGEIEVVAEAGDGLAGVNAVRTHRPDLVVIDLAMPVMDGLEAIPHIREACPQATIIVLSGFGAAAMSDKALAAGADAYLQKGSSPSKILDYIRDKAGYTAPTKAPIFAPPSKSFPLEDALPAMDLAPFGVLTVDPSRDFLATNVNRAASLLLYGLRAGERISDYAPELADRLAGVRGDDEVIELGPGESGRGLAVTVRRSSGLLFCYLRLREASDQAETLRRAIATTAHEVRTPVTVLLGVVDTIREYGDDLTDEQRVRLRESVERQAKLLDSLTADLLTTAQAQRGTLHVETEKVDVRALLEALVSRQPEPIDLKLIGNLFAQADSIRLEQMVNNLISNARKYGEPPIAVDAWRAGDLIRISVTDAGPGVPESFVPKLFDEFTRATGTTARGTGLGLYVARSLAEAQGGTLTYQPGIAGGSVFLASLPAVP